MQPSPDLASIGALVGDQSRAVILAELLDGRALTATELAARAGVAAPTASEHLAKLVAGKLLAVEVQGRHRYYRIASAEIADVLEALGTLAPRAARRAHGQGEGDGIEGMRFARSCYDHLAGRLAVRVRQALLDRGLLVEDGAEHRLTPAGEAVFTSFGVDLQAARQGRRSFARACLDWSERRPHISGSFGAALLGQLLDRGWLLRCVGSRELELTAQGRQGLAALVSLEPGALFG
jgi:DNA-binding transcriptional ArsR family regulator